VTYEEATRRFIAAHDRHGWSQLAFFDGPALDIARELDRRAASGEAIAPSPSQVYAALERTPLQAVRAVIVGQDPYPTPGDAHGLAFSVPEGRALPRSLRTVFEALARDTGAPAPAGGDLTRWAERGVLLLNRALTVGETAANAHARLGWETLAREVIATLAAREGVAFLLWGKPAQALAAGLDSRRHVVVSCAHPSPLARARAPKGAPHPFVAARPFASVNEALAARGLPVIDWTLS
jgi:uracil-DNA glycosylase